MKKEQVILVDEANQEIGQAEKLQAHKDAALHRAFSVFILRQTGESVEVLLHQRHPQKYHCGGLWTNTCCGHPRPGEQTVKAAERRLMEEMGFTTELRELGAFQYKAEFENGLTEHEIDHVFVALHDPKEFTVNPVEVADYMWVGLQQLIADLQFAPEKYTPWLPLALEFILQRSGSVIGASEE